MACGGASFFLAKSGGRARAVFLGVGGEGSAGLRKAEQGAARPSVSGRDVRRVTMATHA
jgi:hypothetical protein